jgi:S-formylglutathione hydrolase FrmB
VSFDIFAQETHPISFSISIAPQLQNQFKPSGRLFVFISENPRGEPRTQLWPLSPRRNHIFAKNLKGWKSSETFALDARSQFISTAQFNFDKVPNGTYHIQALWDHDTTESGIDAPGNLHSEVMAVEINQKLKVDLTINQKIPPRELIENKFVKLVEIQSDTLSAWWGRPMKVKAAVLLPSSYFENTAAKYPVRYNVAGYGGRYMRVNGLLNNKDFSDWWFGKEAPQIINVFLDGEGPWGDSYQLDSENNGPYGYVLINELIPAIEKEFRTADGAKLRFVDGCSTGGWVSLALQLFYPDEFNGAWSYSPDAISFDNYQLINIYKDKNAFYNEWGNLRPVARDLTGDPIVTMKDFIQYENVLGASDSYLNSGGQFSAHTALYSPKGENGLPAPLFDPFTGEIDTLIAESWKKYDLKLYMEKNWPTLGPKLQGKIFIWMGDMDHFYLNPATRAFDEFLKKTVNPKSDAKVNFEAMEGHCSKFSDKEILKMMVERTKQLRR